MGPKRVRRPRWSFEETKLLVDYKQEAFLNGEEGGKVWNQIADDLSRIQRQNFQLRSGDECRRRWDTLKKVYNRIEDYCVKNGQDHWQLDKDELKSLKLATTYRQDWYAIVREVCSKRKGDHRDHTQVRKPLKRRRTTDSSSVPNCTPGSKDQLAIMEPIPIPEQSQDPLLPSAPVLETPNAQYPNATVESKFPTESHGEIEMLESGGDTDTLNRECEAPMLEVVHTEEHEQISEGYRQVHMYTDLVASNHGMPTHSGGSAYLKFLIVPPVDVLSARFNPQPTALPNIPQSDGNVDTALASEWFLEDVDPLQTSALANIPLSHRNVNNGLEGDVIAKYIYDLEQESENSPENVTDDNGGRVVAHRDYRGDPFPSQPGDLTRIQDTEVEGWRAREQLGSSWEGVRQRKHRAPWVAGMIIIPGRCTASIVFFLFFLKSRGRHFQ